MEGCNEKNCTCPKVECERHGKCCECVNHHQQPGMTIVYCFRGMVEEQIARARQGV